jgi:hypothetical protein
MRQEVVIRRSIGIFLPSFEPDDGKDYGLTSSSPCLHAGWVCHEDVGSM